MIVINLRCDLIQMEREILKRRGDCIVLCGFRTDSAIGQLGKQFWRVRVPMDEEHMAICSQHRRLGDIPLLIRGFSLKGKTVYANGELYKAAVGEPATDAAREPHRVEPAGEPELSRTVAGESHQKGVG